MTVTTDRARRARGLAAALALALVPGAIAQSPPATAIETLSSGATGYDFPAVSADGRHVAFVTDVRLDPRDTNARFDIYVRDRVLGTTALVSVTRDGVVGNGSSQRPSLSADGRFVAFSSSASNLVSDDTNDVDDIFVLDRDSGEGGVFDEPDGTILSRVSLDTDGIEANCASARPSISANGRYVAFDSCVTNWAVVFGKTAAVHDIFVHDRARFVTEWVNPATRNSPNRFNNHHSGDASISGDGRFVAFASQATTQPQTLGDFGSSQIYIRDTCRGATAGCQEDTQWASPQVHVDSQPSDAFKPSISADGRFVAYESRSTALVQDDTNAATDIFVFNRQTLRITRVNVSTAGDQALTTQPSTCSGSQHAAISGNGRFVTFESCANNLVADDTVAPNYQDVFVHDRDTDGDGEWDDVGSSTRLISRNPAGITADSSSLSSAISADGQVVVFSSFSRDITPTASPLGIYAWTAGNRRPTADAGSDQSVIATGPDGATVTLNASASTDPDGDPLTFTWTGSFGSLTGVNVSPILEVGTHTVTLTVEDGHGGTATDTVEINVTATGESVELSLAASASPLSVEIGDDIRYAIRVSNDDVVDATGVVVRVAIPARVDFVGANLPPGACTAPPAGTAGVVACTLGQVSAGAFAAFTISLAPHTAGPLTLTIAVVASESDPTPENNHAEVTVTVNPAPAVISIVESIVVSDDPAPRPSALLSVAESISVLDSPGVLPSALLAINESIAVTDTPQTLLATMLTVTEVVTVVDSPEVASSANTPIGTNVPVAPVDAATGISPVRLTFDTVTAPGDTILVIGVAGPPPPPGHTGGRPPRFYDLSTTAAFTGDVEVCVSYTGTTFDSAPSLWHFENGAWVDITVSHDRAQQAICGDTRSLSPFALFASLNQPPSLVLPTDRIAEATSATGAAVVFTATASDREDGPVTPVCVPASGSQFAVGVTAVRCLATDSAGAVAEGRFSITVRDTTPPALTVPHHVNATASSAAGALVTYVASAVDLVDGPVAPICSTASGANFRIGSTTVRCTATDARGNAAQRSFPVTVTVGIPWITARLGDNGPDAAGRFYVDVTLTNSGSGPARQVFLSKLGFLTLAGWGAVEYAAGQSGAPPIAIGPLDVGASASVRFYLKVPRSIYRFLMVETGVVETVTGTRLPLLTAQVIERR